MKFKEVDPEFDYPEIDETIHEYIVARDEGLCQLCGTQGDHKHHIIFKSAGGTNKPNNLILLCTNKGTNDGCHDAVHQYKVGKKVGKMLLKVAKRNEKRFRRRLV